MRQDIPIDWLTDYDIQSAGSDAFEGRNNHLELLAAGLFGEAGSILAEVKKMSRETAAYPKYRARLSEELGDFLWYFIRLASLLGTDWVPDPARKPDVASSSLMAAAANLGVLASAILQHVTSKSEIDVANTLQSIWIGLHLIAESAEVQLASVAAENLRKTQSRWPKHVLAGGVLDPALYSALFDSEYPVYEQLPRKMNVYFSERPRGTRTEVLMRANEINIGARVTDNILDEDHYRYHDIFHISYAVFLGWSPVTRSLYKCKRKSVPIVDENQDGARAVVIEEAISALVFSRAKRMEFFAGADKVDYDLLKIIEELVRGFEVEVVPAWQWERAILVGFDIFHEIRKNRCGIVSWDIEKRALSFHSQRPQ